MNNKEQLIQILTQAYRKYSGYSKKNAWDIEIDYQYYWFTEIKTLDDVDIDKVIQLYQSKTTEPMNINNRLLLLSCVYETIVDNKKYQELVDKLIDIYKIELDDKLTKQLLRYDDFKYVESPNEIYHALYTTMPEYSLILANMCTRYIDESQKHYVEDSILPSTKVESRISTYEEIKADFAKSGKQMPEVQEQIVFQAKEMVIQANEERKIISEREKQQREIELINLQQEIVKMENEKLEIEKKIKVITSKTLSSYYSEQVLERYPEEYQNFQQYKNQVKNYSRNHTSIDDIKLRFNKLSEELQLYKEALPVYESFYQRFKEMERENQQRNQVTTQIDNPQSVDELRQNISRYLKMQNKMIYVTRIDINNIYQKGNFIIVEAQDNLGHFIERSFTKEEFSKLFMPQSNEFKQNETFQPVQELPNETMRDESTFKEINIESVINQIKEQYPDVIIIEANGAFEYEGQYRVNVTYYNGTLGSIIIDKETYDKLVEYFRKYPQSISTYISKQVEIPVQQEEMNSGMHR